jgi:uncharacterized protein with von Willebrand factor type A (vWA) domain
MAYAWRSLRRPVPYGPADVLDVQATVEQVARQGFYLSPVYRRGLRNAAHLVLLIDQGGSMVPFHRFTRDLAETARAERGFLREPEVFYFHNVAPAGVCRDAHLTSPVPWAEASAYLSSLTGVLVVSDAGAARGYRRLPRVRATTELLSRLRRRTPLVAWLNPMPQQRWPGTSAQMIGGLVPMFPMDPAGLSHALEVLRGHTLPRGR